MSKPILTLTLAALLAVPVVAATVAPDFKAILAGSQRSPANQARDQYRHPAETLKFFGIKHVKLLTNNPRKIGALEDAGIEVDRERHQLASNPLNLRYLKTKARKSGHMLDFEEEAL